jgi:hypothetical protein
VQQELESRFKAIESVASRRESSADNDKHRGLR